VSVPFIFICRWWLAGLSRILNLWQNFVFGYILIIDVECVSPNRTILHRLGVDRGKLCNRFDHAHHRNLCIEIYL
jgi:hypothetical protein